MLPFFFWHVKKPLKVLMVFSIFTKEYLMAPAGQASSLLFMLYMTLTSRLNAP